MRPSWSTFIDPRPTNWFWMALYTSLEKLKDIFMCGSPVIPASVMESQHKHTSFYLISYWLDDYLKCSDGFGWRRKKKNSTTLELIGIQKYLFIMSKKKNRNVLSQKMKGSILVYLAEEYSEHRVASIFGKDDSAPTGMIIRAFECHSTAHEAVMWPTKRMIRSRLLRAGLKSCREESGWGLNCRGLE